MNHMKKKDDPPGVRFGYCQNFTEEFSYGRPNMFDVDSNNAPVGKPDVLLQTGCPDCMAVKGEDKEDMSSLFLLSRRKNITDAELKEFESQVKCLGWSKPEVLNTDHDFENCLSLDDDEDDFDIDKISSLITQRLSKTSGTSLKCLSDTAFRYHNVAYKWVRQQWSSFW